MAYGDSSLAKERLKITGSSEDTYIGHLITEADAEIDSNLQSYDTVPLTPVPEIIKQISTDLACSYYIENRDGKENFIGVRARRMLNRYIEKKYFSGVYEGQRSEIES